MKGHHSLHLSFLFFIIGEILFFLSFFHSSLIVKIISFIYILLFITFSYFTVYLYYILNVCNFNIISSRR